MNESSIMDMVSNIIDVKSKLEDSTQIQYRDCNILNAKKKFLNTNFNKKINMKNNSTNLKTERTYPMYNCTMPLNIVDVNANNQKNDSFNSDNSSKQINYARYKTELCRQFNENGICKYGDKCQFAHGLAELKVVNRHPKYKTELCSTFHSTGFCAYGPRCNFIHDAYDKCSYSAARKPFKSQNKFTHSPPLVKCESVKQTLNESINQKSSDEFSCISSGSLSPTSSYSNSCSLFSPRSSTPPQQQQQAPIQFLQHNVITNNSSTYLKLPVLKNTKNSLSTTYGLNNNQLLEMYQCLYTKLCVEQRILENVKNDNQLLFLNGTEESSNNLSFPDDSKQRIISKYLQ